MSVLMLNAPSAKYPIYIEEGILSRCGTVAAGILAGRRAVIVTDCNVGRLYAAVLESTLNEVGFETKIITLEAGESAKSWKNVLLLYSAFSEHEITRADGVFALGGGVIGDLAGFAAGTFLRGVPYFQLPTSLLAQVDSSVGGKTAINLPEGKNLAGMFYQPKAVFVDRKTLNTLPKEHFSEGMAEVIKYGLISDMKLFSGLEKESGITQKSIETCIDIKRKIVERDEYDTGEREVLNFGHTLGHAVEAKGNYERFSHGQAVAIGMVLAVRLGIELGITPEGIYEKVLGILKKHQLPDRCPYSKEELLPYLLRDKKRRGKSINLILLKDIGEAVRAAVETAKLPNLIEKALS